MKKNNVIMRVGLPLLCMILISAVIVLATAGVRQNIWGSLDQPISGLPSITSSAPLDVAIPQDSAVKKVEVCRDATESVAAYRVQIETFGFNSEVPIVLNVTISADGTAVREIAVVSHKETEYYGSRIKDASFIERFVDRHLPLCLTGESGRGAHVDGLSGATISSQAVIDAVNEAADFVNVHILNVEE